MQMQISRKADFALRVVGYLATLKEARLAPLAEIAEREHVPGAFLETLLRPLVHHGYVQVEYEGAGGYRLARHPDQITFKEIIETVDGPVVVHECIPFEGACGRADCCYQIPIWREIQDAIDHALSNRTIGELAALVERSSQESLLGKFSG